ncbi:MAG: ATP-binding protein [Flavobacteriaceae bacterium]|nr:ATP-binding protein [Flavobacteriaceae bacterium]
MQQKIVITGGPGTGKSTILNELIHQKYTCMPEISREIILKAREGGTEQLFLKKPLLFSQLLLEGRKNQFLQADKMKTEIVFFDRGIPDTHAYMNYLGIDYPSIYKKISKKNRYTTIFMLPSWQEIYTSDNERYENFEQSLVIQNHLKETYTELGYDIIEVPKGTIEKRVRFILNAVNL